MKLTEKQGSKGDYYVVQHKGRTAKYKKYTDVPLSAYKEKFMQNSRKSVLSFVKGRRPILIRMTTKGGDIIRIAKGGRTETIKISPLQENEFRKAIGLYLTNKIPRRRIKDAAAAYTNQDASLGLSKIASLMKGYKPLSELLAKLPRSSKSVMLDQWTSMDRKSVYTKIAQETSQEEIVEQMMKIGNKIDQRLYYTIEIINKEGQPIGTIQVKNRRPEDLKRWLGEFKTLADNGALESEHGQDLFSAGGGMPKNSRVGRAAIPVQQLNRKVGGFRVGVMWKGV